ncbi:hypothetical protein FB446DRAFT_794887 [Lentinula raphanica]|nr:hypothetical protein FB446DRAFT_794887 [Lentinula raphanica]
MSHKICTPEALRVLYGCRQYQDLIELAMRNVDNQWEIFHSMIHLRPFLNSFEEPIRWDIPLLWKKTAPFYIRFALAFWASDVPMKLRVPSGDGTGPEYIRSSEGLSWLVENYFKANPHIEVKVPALVWTGLFDVSSNKKFQEPFKNLNNSWALVWRNDSYPISCPVDIKILIKLTEGAMGSMDPNGVGHDSNLPIVHESSMMIENSDSKLMLEARTKES